MGTATFVKSTTPKSAITGTSNIKLHVDVPLLLIVLALLVYGSMTCLQLRSLLNRFAG
jgi:hypothetical protein